MTNRFFCVHGHFYQPPREDPFTGLIPPEPGASPYQNWNERIHAECYRPNAELANFERISFNIGPTLFAWMRQFDPATCRLILAQDRANVRQYGIGNAIAQSYNHTILPLSPYMDKVTQVRWGIADFVHQFGRKPQGMWLPEAAVDLETLQILADHGITFTILAPWQADRDTIDPTEPYRVKLAEGSSINVFFYHRELSSGVSFNPAVTNNADAFTTSYLLPSYLAEKDQRQEPQLLLVASDGELYGHHQPFRDYFLSHLLNGASEHAGLMPIYPGLWLQRYPVRKDVEIRENTSWSCLHGVTRWNGTCACTPGDGRWKGYFRNAFIRLAAELEIAYANGVNPYGIDPWELRHRYIHVLLGDISVEELINEAAHRVLTKEDNQRIQLLLRAQFERQRMFTSCGWYFDDFDRIEPKNNVAYAVNAIQLTRQAAGIDLSAQAMTDLRLVVSHRSGLRGDVVFQRHLLRAQGLSSST